jgi:hypothetical protein
MPPPAAEVCLVTARSANKGGTRIAEDVGDVATHLRRLAQHGGYRPDRCPRCLCTTLHVHSYPTRLLRADGGDTPVVRVVQYICTRADCGATWRILPLFLARHLSRTWRTVERTVKPVDTPSPREGPTVPARTERRWRSRLACSARVVALLLTVSGSAALAAISTGGLDSTRGDLVDRHAEAASIAPGARLATLAALVDRLEQGIRLM